PRPENPDQPEQWYLSYADLDASPRMLTGDVATLCQALEEGKVANVASARVSQSKGGPFRALEQCAEFRNAKPADRESEEAGAKTEAAREPMPPTQQLARPAPAATASQGRRPSLLANDDQILEPDSSLLRGSETSDPTGAGGERGSLLLVLL